MSSSARPRASSSYYGGPARFRCECVDGQWQAEAGDQEEFSVRMSADTLIGSGSMGAVYKVTFRGAPAAGKTFHAFSNPSLYGLDLQQQSSREQLAELAKKAEPEITVLMSILRHPSLCSCLGVGYTSLCGIDVPMWIIMELADENLKMSLHGEGGGALLPAEALRRWIQVLIGLDVLHALGIVHRNIKPCNILVRKEKRRLLLADYGLARLRSSIGELMRSSNGSRGDMSRSSISSGRAQGIESLYQGPEGSSSSTSSGRKGDTYAAALCLAEMLTGEEPSESHEARAQWIQRASERLPNPAATALVRAANQDPKNRPPVAETLFSIFDSLTTIDRQNALQVVPEQSSIQDVVARNKMMTEKVQAWEELYQTAAAARDELHQQLNACSSELQTHRTASECRQREVVQLKICKAEMQAEGKALREELAQQRTKKPATDEQTFADEALLQSLMSALSEQCRLAEEGERRLLANEALAERRIGELGAIVETREESTAAILQEFATAMATQEAVAAAAELRLQAASQQASYASSCAPTEAPRIIDESTANRLRVSEELVEEQQRLVQALEKSRFEQQHEIARLRSELAETKLNLVAASEVAAPEVAASPEASASTAASPEASTIAFDDRMEPSISQESATSSLRGRPGYGRSNSQPLVRIRMPIAEDGALQQNLQPQAESELQKVLNQRRNKVASREKVFEGNEQPASQADASWKKKRTTLYNKTSQHEQHESSAPGRQPSDDSDQDADALSFSI